MQVSSQSTIVGKIVTVEPAMSHKLGQSPIKNHGKIAVNYVYFFCWKFKARIHNFVTLVSIVRILCPPRSLLCG